MKVEQTLVTISRPRSCYANEQNVIDLHSHILPAIDDGAPDLPTAIEMARQFVDNGVRVLACTPHIMPGVWNNSGPMILKRIQELQCVLNERNIPLNLVSGADVHISPSIVKNIRNGQVLTLHRSRFILIELPHHVVPVRADSCFYELMAAGYKPILTHPERVTWIEQNYALIERLAASGVWMQVTSGSLAGRFGKRAKYWAEKMVIDGLVHILASDAHNTRSRPPDLADGWKAARQLVGDEEAKRFVLTRPYAILKNELGLESPSLITERPDNVPSKQASALPKGSAADDSSFTGWLRRLTQRS